ncbi:MAG: hypothetical protein BMS9Abin13_615 [Patescibacteria group bacterium]|nr:MAG: hypothetical protein BMS9Abin13_615 [Patescibacteria group bacterium]
MPTLYIILIFFAIGTIGIIAGYLFGHPTFKNRSAPFSEQDAKRGRQTIQERIQKRKNRIMVQAEKAGRITNDDVEDMFCISDSTATNYLSELEEEGKLTQKGSGRSTYYTPTPIFS